jgi:adenylate cyclase
MSGDAEQEYFADGIVEDIITALSRVRWFFVIAGILPSPTKEAVDIRRSGRPRRPLRAEGSVRKAGLGCVLPQLIEALQADIFGRTNSTGRSTTSLTFKTDHREHR